MKESDPVAKKILLELRSELRGGLKMISAIEFMKVWRNECKWHVYCSERAICYGCPILINKSDKEINDFVTIAIAKNAKNAYK